MKQEFINIKTEDGLILPGLFHEVSKSKKAMIVLHGNGSSSIFYENTPNKAFSEALSKKGISYLTFNNRGAHIKKSFHIQTKTGKKKIYEGMAYEIIKDCVKDIDGAINFLKKRGYKEFYLIGFSTGANKICVYNHYKKKNNKVSKYILVGGSDDTGSYYSEIGKQKFSKLLKKAQKMKKKGRGNELISDLLPEVLSWQAFYDVANPDGDYNTFPFYEVLRKVKLSKKPLFRYFKAIQKPSLVVYGGEDEYAWGAVPKVVDLLKEKNPNLDYKIIKGGDHGLSGHLKELTKLVVGWL